MHIPFDTADTVLKFYLNLSDNGIKMYTQKEVYYSSVYKRRPVKTSNFINSVIFRTSEKIGSMQLPLKNDIKYILT
jgi:hypothetical protein